MFFIRGPHILKQMDGLTKKRIKWHLFLYPYSHCKCQEEEEECFVNCFFFTTDTMEERMFKFCMIHDERYINLSKTYNSFVTSDCLLWFFVHKHMKNPISEHNIVIKIARLLIKSPRDWVGSIEIVWDKWNANLNLR